MQNLRTLVPAGTQVVDMFRARLRSGRDIKFDFVGRWQRTRSQTRRGGAPVKLVLLNEAEQERVVWRDIHEETPLFDKVMYVLDSAYAYYSRAKQRYDYRYSFEIYLEFVLMHGMRSSPVCWPRLSEAAEALRITRGLPRFTPTNPWSTSEHPLGLLPLSEPWMTYRATAYARRMC